MPHAIPKTVKLVMVVTHASRVGFEGNISDSTLSLNSMETSSIRIGFVGRDSIEGECLGCLLYQSAKVRTGINHGGRHTLEPQDGSRLEVTTTDTLPEIKVRKC